MLAPIPPQKTPSKYKSLINPITASDMAKLSAQARRTKSAKRLTAKSVTDELDYHQFIKTYGIRLQFMLHRCAILFDKAKSGAEAERVASAISKLFDVWGDITQTPKRGALRPEKMKGLIRSYGMRSALDKMLAQPSIVMANETTAIDNTQPPVTNKVETLGLTTEITPPNTNQKPPSESPTNETPNETPIDPLKIDDEEGPEPDPISFVEKKESLISQADPSPPSTPPPPALTG